MTHARKQSIAIAMLLALAIWPLIHFGLVQRFGISPWKFGGFAMYCTPNPLLEITIFRSDHQEVPIVPQSALARQHRQYGDAWAIWNEHRPPEAFWNALREAEPQGAPFLVLVRERRLDPRTARMVQRRRRYFWPAE
ncbi:MAG: hypothetical protein DWQ31_17915 [Planctomycetota bacterium]|nr:MAG: hypothetical protein DWQ31_17915 [Planctomycetota bacterium]REJ97359.1 MAG: hypothetical protein DWQ35_02035 [Planctomycetota bacterium]REK27730.1 MAG: hypothetical protein DWQ42_07135 [Planctomycetota bacterium]REK48129.1 MAG: hypothetical protein DWQ46_02885 [Planctomycetota bacterium]